MPLRAPTERILDVAVRGCARAASLEVGYPGGIRRWEGGGLGSLAPCVVASGINGECAWEW